MSYFDFTGERVRVHGIAVVLRCDGYFSSAEIFNGLIGTTMSEL